MWCQVKMIGKLVSYPVQEVRTTWRLTSQADGASFLLLLFLFSSCVKFK